MRTRREVILGGLLTLVVGEGFSCNCAAQSQTRSRKNAGCWLADSDVTKFYPAQTDTALYITGNEPMIPKSGDKNFDLALAKTLAKISTMLEILPSFAYYDDYDGLNAYATPKVRMANADGTVLFGQRLLKRLMASPESPEVGVAAVCAHEFGHILQYKRGLMSVVGAGQPTVKRTELQADFFAGYFAGLRKLERPSFPAAVVAMTQYNFGDNMVSEPSHHGTPTERANSIVRGFEAAYKTKLKLADAITLSVSYVNAL